MSQPQPSFPTVCGRTIHNDPRYYASAEYQGRIIHFCTEFCLEAFRADPQRFYNAHSQKKTRAPTPPQNALPVTET